MTWDLRSISYQAGLPSRIALSASHGHPVAFKTPRAGSRGPPLKGDILATGRRAWTSAWGEHNIWNVPITLSVKICTWRVLARFFALRVLAAEEQAGCTIPDSQ